MKKTALALLFALGLFAQPADAQIIVDLHFPGYYGIPSNYYSYTYGPSMYYYYDAKHIEVIYTAQKLLQNGAPAGGGKIPAIAFYGYSYGSYSSLIDQMSIKMAHTQQDNWMTTVTTTDEMTARQPPPWTIPNIPNGQQQWVRIEFDEPFIWNGTDNIVVTLCSVWPNLVYGNTATYHNYLNVQYGYETYPPNYTNSEYKTRYRYNYAYYGNVNSDWCQTFQSSGTGNYGPYTTYVRPDMRFEICNGAPSVYDATVPGLQYLPGTLPVQWNLGHPDQQFMATVTISLYRPDGSFVTSQNFQVPINADFHSGTFNFPLTNIAPGYYRVETAFMTLDECNNLVDHIVNRPLMILNPGSTPCEVWPGDVNNDGIVNYGDRHDLNTYIHDAMLSSAWLQGPARFRVDADIDPLTYLTWEAQYSVPWQTAQGCFMDADGNGVVNNFDYIAIKMNWNRAHGAIAPKQDAAGAMTFAMDQNFPNPFNPSTSISYTVPERSQVRLVVSDMLGREVATIVDGAVEAGRHLATFDAAQLSSGKYVARVEMTGIESGQTFTKAIGMTLSK